MSRYLDGFIEHAAGNPDAIAYTNTAGEAITYGDLHQQSDRLCAFLHETNPQRKPVAIYGHKEPMMFTCMLACIKAGCAFVPLDIVYPKPRIEGILSQLGDSMLLCAANPNEPIANDGETIDSNHLQELTTSDDLPLPHYATPDKDDALYILFTSGSTGKPKGVVQRFELLDILVDYFARYCAIDEDGNQLPHQMQFNRAPYSFDVGLFTLITTLPFGHTAFSLDEICEKSFAKMFAQFKEANINVWYSTPSFLVMCMADPSFNENLLPNAQKFIVAGETLHNVAARTFFERFPHAQLINAYGPTEGNVITDVVITPEMAQSSVPLPVGYPSPYLEIQILDPNTLDEVPVGNHGEICVVGEHVGAGYYHEPEKTAAAFGMRADRNGNMRRFYRTGDEGYMTEDGLVFFIGRYDFQVKVNGYRVELGEIEEVLNTLDEVIASCVFPIERNGIYTALRAHVLLGKETEGSRELMRTIKDRLRETLPAYMIPRTIVFHNDFPFNANGKIDRKALQQND